MRAFIQCLFIVTPRSKVHVPVHSYKNISFISVQNNFWGLFKIDNSVRKLQVSAQLSSTGIFEYLIFIVLLVIKMSEILWVVTQKCNFKKVVLSSVTRKKSPNLVTLVLSDHSGAHF